MMDELSAELLVTILGELAWDPSIVSYSRVCKFWKSALCNRDLWKSAAIRRISDHLKATAANASEAIIEPSPNFLHDVCPELIGLNSSEAFHWKLFADLLTTPSKFRMPIPQDLSSIDLDKWLNAKALSLLTAASIMSSKHSTSTQRKTSLIPQHSNTSGSQDVQQ